MPLLDQLKYMKSEALCERSKLTPVLGLEKSRCSYSQSFRAVSLFPDSCVYVCLTMKNLTIFSHNFCVTKDRRAKWQLENQQLLPLGAGRFAPAPVGGLWRKMPTQG